jgi:predicted RNase H-like HicB family nuclease
MRKEAAMATKYTVVYEQDETGSWCGHLAELPGVLTQGRSIRQVRARIREALWAWTDDRKLADAAELVDDIRVPAPIRKSVRKAQRDRSAAEQAQATASESLRDAAKRLTEEAGLSVRDAAELLGVSHQRVQQLVSKAG